MSDGRVVIDILADAKQYQATVAGLSAETNKIVASMTAGMKTAGMGLTLALTAPLLLFGAYSVKAAMDFESSFAGVRKTTNATEAEFEKLAQASKKMATEKVIDANAVNHVMELGSQLGITKNNLVDFAGVIADLDVSTNLNTEEAATQMARYANITGMAQGEFDRFGSTLVALGNTSATTESDIMAMSMRIAGSASQVGMADDQILALAASLSSVGIEAEMGGTAISTVISQIDKDVATNGSTLSTWADTCGMSVADFKRAWETDAAGAMQSLFAGMNAASESGGNLNLVLDQMGITSLRQGDMMKRMSNASVLLGASFGTANVAWNENTALARESEQRYMTTESQAKILGNQMQNVASTMGGPLLASVNAIIGSAQPFLDVLKSGAEGFAHMDEGQRNMIVGLALVAAGLGPALLGMSKFISVTTAMSGSAAKLAANLAAENAAIAASSAAAQASAVGYVKSLGVKSTAQAASTVSLKFNSAAHQANAKVIIANMQANLAENAAKTTNTAATGINTATTAANTAAKGAGAAAATADAAATVTSTGVKGAATVATNVLTAAQLTFNAAVKANPIGAVLLAVGALTAALAGLASILDSNSRENTELSATTKQHQAAVNGLRTEYEQAAATYGETSNEALKLKASLDEQNAAFDAGKQTIRQMYEECDKAIKSHSELKTHLDESTASAESEAGGVLLLAGRIEELGGKSGKTAADQAVLVSLLEEAGQKIPGVTAQYDAHNDTMSQSTEVINKLAAAEANRIKAKAHMDNYNKLLADQAGLEEQLRKVQVQAEAEGQKYVGNKARGVKTTSDASKKEKELSAAIKECTDKQVVAAQCAAESAEADRKLNEAVTAVTEGHLTAADAAAKFGADEQLVGAMVAQSQEEQKTAVVDAKNEMRKAIDDYAAATPAFKQALDNSGMSVDDFASKLEAQGITMDSAAGTIESYRDRLTSAFDAIEVNRENTAAKAASTLQKNIDATASWNSNLSYLYNESGLSFNSDFISAVTSGGPEEYGQMMADLVAATQSGGSVMVDGVAMTAQQIIDKFAEAGNLAPKQYLVELGANGELLNAAGQEVPAQVGQGIVDGSGKMWSAAEYASMTTGDKMQIKDALAKGEDIASLWAQGLANKTPESTANAEAAAQGVKTALGGIGDAATVAGGEVGAKLAEGIAGQAPAVQGAIQGLSGAVTTSLVSTQMGALQAGTQIGAQVALGISSQSVSVQMAMFGLSSVIASAAAAIQLQPIGVSITTGLAAGMSAGSSQVVAAASGTTAAIMATVQAVQLHPVGLLMLVQLANGMRAGSSSAMSAAQSVAGSVISVMGNAAGRTVNIGEQMSAGMAVGIRSNASKVEQAMADVINDAIARGIAEAKIHSPSRRTRDEIGKWLPLGAAEGIDEYGHTMSDSMADAVDETIRQAAYGMGDLGHLINDSGLSLSGVSIGVVPSNPIDLVGSWQSSGDTTSNVVKAIDAMTKRIDLLDSGLSRKIAENTPSVIRWNEREMGRFLKKTNG